MIIPLFIVLATIHNGVKNTIYVTSTVATVTTQEVLC